MARSTSETMDLMDDALISRKKKPKRTEKVDKIIARNLNEVEVQEEQVTVDETSEEQSDLRPELESQHTNRSMNSSGRPFSNLFAKTKTSVGAAGVGAAAKTNSAGSGGRPIVPSSSQGNGKWDAMYTKALFTPEDSTAIAQTSPLYLASNNNTNQKAGFQSIPSSGESSTNRYLLSQTLQSDVADDECRHQDDKVSNGWKFSWIKNENEKQKTHGKSKKFVTKVTPSWKFGRKNHDTIPVNFSMKSLKLVKSTSFWKKAKEHGSMLEKTNSEPRKRSRKLKKKSKASAYEGSAVRDSELNHAAPIQPICIKPAALSKPKSNAVTELDEYSVHEGLLNEPALVQCLKFYSCGTLAEKVNAAFKVANCQGAVVEDEEDNDFDSGGARYMPGTPEPAVEVVLDNLLHQHEQKSPAMGSQRSVSSRRSILSCADTNSWEDALRTAPSILIEVTDKQLHLDEDISLQKWNEPLRIAHVADPLIAPKIADFSVTSVRIPQGKSRKTAAKNKKNQNKEERAAPRRIEKTETTNSEEETATDYNSSHANEMEEGYEHLSECKHLNNVASPGRLQKLVGRFRKK